MGLIRLNLKQLLNLNFLFLSIATSILGAISLRNFNGNAGTPLWMDKEYLMADGYIALFIFFAGEINKDLLQQEKLTKRLEWKIANGIRIRSILLENTIVLWMGTILLLSPLGVMIHYRMEPVFFGIHPIRSFAAGCYLMTLCLLYAAVSNIAVLWLKDMNRFRSIPVLLTAGHILIVTAKYWLYSVTNSRALLLLFPLVVMLLLTISGLFCLTKERIVSSYY